MFIGEAGTREADWDAVLIVRYPSRQHFLTMMADAQYRQALQNVTKYATATGATVHLYREDSHLAFQVIDDGVGFDANAKGQGTGIQGMACRCHRVGPLGRARLR